MLRCEVLGDDTLSMGEDGLQIPPHPESLDKTAEEAPADTITNPINDPGATVRQLFKQMRVVPQGVGTLDLPVHKPTPILIGFDESPPAERQSPHPQAVLEHCSFASG